MFSPNRVCPFSPSHRKDLDTKNKMLGDRESVTDNFLLKISSTPSYRSCTPFAPTMLKVLRKLQVFASSPRAAALRFSIPGCTPGKLCPSINSGHFALLALSERSESKCWLSRAGTEVGQALLGGLARFYTTLSTRLDHIKKLQK